MQKLMILIATFFGVGRSPKAPGTFGTLAAILLVWPLQMCGAFVYMAFIIVAIPISMIASEVYGRVHGEHDSGAIVIDEVVGFLITMTWLPMTWQAYLGGFLLFRFFDILKPFPISYLDRNIKGGAGVVIDDVAAGLCANVILQVIFTKTVWLGSQLITV